MRLMAYKINRRKHEKGIKGLAKKMWESRLVWALFTFFLGYFLRIYLDPIILPKISENPELSIQIFQSHAPYQAGDKVYNITWEDRYVEYIVMIQQNMEKAKSTSIEDIHIVFDFNLSVLVVHEESRVDVSDPLIQLPYVQTVGPVEIKPLQVILEIEELRPGGLYSFTVVIDPYFQGSTFRSEIGFENAFFGHYYYNAKGVRIRKTISGNIPTG